MNDINNRRRIPTFTETNETPAQPIIGEYGLYFGRITEEKGVDIVEKAYEKLPQNKVKIMGDDSTEEAVRLKSYCMEKMLTNIEFVGFKQGEELEEVVKKCRFT